MVLKKGGPGYLVMHLGSCGWRYLLCQFSLIKESREECEEEKEEAELGSGTKNRQVGGTVDRQVSN